MQKNDDIDVNVERYIDEKLEILEELYVFGPRGAKEAKKNTVSPLQM